MRFCSCSASRESVIRALLIRAQRARFRIWHRRPTARRPADGESDPAVPCRRSTERSCAKDSTHDVRPFKPVTEKARGAAPSTAPRYQLAGWTTGPRAREKWRTKLPVRNLPPGRPKVSTPSLVKDETLGIFDFEGTASRGRLKCLSREDLAEISESWMMVRGAQKLKPTSSLAHVEFGSFQGFHPLRSSSTACG